ncbi:hypothetical protein Patl1_30209 [Pistacia atlantica]|uniref:Uncharacterized protein n=1 Tax=Pistacia atlantica TaxID=434234 RepID=A0ACC1A8X2_9ROSI|nr:hypothetical protein Patl1_30209 [Pistacia atlantica]
MQLYLTELGFLPFQGMGLKSLPTSTTIQETVVAAYAMICLMLNA